MAEYSAMVCPLDSAKFEGIPLNITKRDMLPAFCISKALNRRHIGKNAMLLLCFRESYRYPDILPNPSTRVKMTQTEPTDPSTTYINANFVRGWNSQSFKYIAAQGPTAETILTFVRMLWEQKTEVIVMLTRLKEGSKHKCEPYFPSRINEPRAFGDISMVMTISETNNRGRTRNLLKLTRGESVRYIAHYWFQEWPDHGVPKDDGGQYETKKMIELIKEVREYRKKHGTIHVPSVIHCSAGVGRTGAYIAVDMALDSLEGKKKVDLNAFTRLMREDRMASIQHTSQYEWAWHAVCDYIQITIAERRAAAHVSNTNVSSELRGICPVCSKEVTTDHDRFKNDSGDYVHSSCCKNLAVPAVTAAAVPKAVSSSVPIDGNSVTDPFMASPARNSNSMTPDPFSPVLNTTVRNNAVQDPFSVALAPPRANANDASLTRSSTVTCNPFLQKAGPPSKPNPFTSIIDGQMSSTVERKPNRRSSLPLVLNLDTRPNPIGKSKSNPFDAISKINEVSETQQQSQTPKANPFNSQPAAATSAISSDDTSVVAVVANPFTKVTGVSHDSSTTDDQQWFSDLQPWTYIDASDKIGRLLDAPIIPSFKAHSAVKDRIKLPSEIIGPAIVSHDQSWRSILAPGEFAKAKAKAS